MSSKFWTIAGLISTVLFGIPSWWTLFIEHPDTLNLITDVLKVISPVVLFALGCFTGYHLRKWRHEVGLSKDIEIKDAEIERLERIYSELAKEVHANTGEVNKALARELRGLELKDGE